MKLSFSTLACPDWSFPEIISIASASGYDGIELRHVENEDALWKLPAFSGSGLTTTTKALADYRLRIACVDTSCRFHFPDASERARWIEEGERMSDLASALGAPGIRVFGDKIQPGADRTSTRAWIADSIRKLAETTTRKGVDVWLETHGDFANSVETSAILAEANTPHAAVVWDPANCFIESGELPRNGARDLGPSIRHVHVKDMLRHDDNWKLVLTGEGNFPLIEVRDALRSLNYNEFVSFEWEKKWHPEIADATIALPQFARWFRGNWQS